MSFVIAGGFDPVGRVHKGVGLVPSMVGVVPTTWWVGPTGVLACFGPFSVPGANEAVLSSAATSGRRQREFPV